MISCSLHFFAKPILLNVLMHTCACVYAVSTMHTCTHVHKYTCTRVHEYTSTHVHMYTQDGNINGMNKCSTRFWLIELNNIETGWCIITRDSVFVRLSTQLIMLPVCERWCWTHIYWERLLQQLGGFATSAEVPWEQHRSLRDHMQRTSES